MPEYIKREDALEITKRTSGDYATAFAEIRKIPAADVIPVVHGKWIEKQEETYCPPQFGEDGALILHKYINYFCNLCGRRSIVPEPYCHCGAKMEGDVNNETN